MLDSGQMERIQDRMAENREVFAEENKIGKAKYWQDILLQRSGQEDTTLKDADYYIWSVGQLAEFDNSRREVINYNIRVPAEEI